MRLSTWTIPKAAPLSIKASLALVGTLVMLALVASPRPALASSLWNFGIQAGIQGSSGGGWGIDPGYQYAQPFGIGHGYANGNVSGLTNLCGTSCGASSYHGAQFGGLPARLPKLQLRQQAPQMPNIRGGWTAGSPGFPGGGFPGGGFPGGGVPGYPTFPGQPGIPGGGAQIPGNPGYPGTFPLPGGGCQNATPCGGCQQSINPCLGYNSGIPFSGHIGVNAGVGYLPQVAVPGGPYVQGGGCGGRVYSGPCGGSGGFNGGFSGGGGINLGALGGGNIIIDQRNTSDRSGSVGLAWAAASVLSHNSTVFPIGYPRHEFPRPDYPFDPIPKVTEFTPRTDLNTGH